MTQTLTIRTTPLNPPRKAMNPPGSFILDSLNVSQLFTNEAAMLEDEGVTFESGDNPKIHNFGAIIWRITIHELDSTAD